MMWFTNFSQAQGIQKENIWIGDIIFMDTPTETKTDVFIIDEISYNMIQKHLTIAWVKSNTMNYEEETLATIRRLEELTKTDIISILNVSTNKQETLIKYLNDCEQNIQNGNNIVVYMKQEMGALKQDMQSCINEKTISDKSYFDAIDRYDQKIMETSLTESIHYENCATENRIQYNAKTNIIQKLVFYLWILQKKYDIIFAKQEIVIDNFEIFRDKILPDLNIIDQILEQYKF